MDDIDKMILKHLFEGKTAREIGHLVFRSHKTVEYRLAQMREDNNCRNNVHLAITLLPYVSEMIENIEELGNTISTNPIQ